MASYDMSRRGQLWFESRDIRGVYVRECAIGASVPGGARHPKEATSGVENKGDFLRRRTEGERNGVAPIAASIERSARSSMKSSTRGYIFLRVFEMMNSINGSFNKI